MNATNFLTRGSQSIMAPASYAVIALVGLAFEARIAANPNVLVLRGKTGDELIETIDAGVERGCRAIVSFGVAGGLVADLKPGDLVIASSILENEIERQTDAVWSSKLLSAMPGARYALIAGVDAPVVTPQAKRELNARTGAVAIDMESHLVARLAAERGLAFVAIRVIIDPVDRTVPPIALAGMRGDGSTSIAAVLSGLIADPKQTISLGRLAVDLYAARNSLLRVRRSLGHGFGLLDPA